jgi:seryl-tRNA synthetase
MLDPKALKSRRDEIVESCHRRRMRVDVDGALSAQERLNAVLTELNDANRRRNEHQKAGKQKLSAEERSAHVETGRGLKREVAELEAKLRDLQQELDEMLMELPNFIHPEVPEGGEEDFRIVKEGTPPELDFEPLDHLELCRRHDLVDFETGAAVAGQKWYYLKNEAALLDVALQRFALDILMEEGFTPVVTPDLARPSVVSSLGYNPRGPETQIYSIADHDLCLVGTAEITLGGMYAGKIVDESDLPIRLAGVSHCFRTEAGSHGRESKGLYRVHQFTKTEMFVFCRPEDSEDQLEDLRRIEERLFGALEIPFRVIEVASGDLGAPAYRKYDLEAWMPGRGDGGGWGEITSASNCTDFQARRLRTRFRRKGAKKPEIVHTLNGTAISNARAILTLLETHQRADGSIAIPKSLVPYMGRESIGSATGP